MNKPRLHAGGVFILILLASTTIDLAFDMWVKSSIFKIAFLRVNVTIHVGRCHAVPLS
jgi:putative effector of murein hydrolase